jgi:hypothetical protein
MTVAQAHFLVGMFAKTQLNGNVPGFINLSDNYVPVYFHCKLISDVSDNLAKASGNYPILGKKYKYLLIF